jgi:hypothetical protein
MQTVQDILNLLQTNVVAHDRKFNKKNPFALGKYMEAVNKIRDAMKPALKEPASAHVDKIRKLVSDVFESDFPPAKKLLKDLSPMPKKAFEGEANYMAVQSLQKLVELSPRLLKAIEVDPSLLEDWQEFKINTAAEAMSAVYDSMRFGDSSVVAADMNAPIVLQKGDIVAGTWSYEMSIPYFYEVQNDVRAGQMAILRELEQQQHDGDSWTGHVLPVKNQYKKNSPIKKKVSMYRDVPQIKVKDRLYVSPWSGRPLFFNHLD